MTRSRSRCTRLHQRLGVLGKSRVNLNEERTYCYCDAWDLAWPHYLAEHIQGHDDDRELRARKARG